LYRFYGIKSCSVEANIFCRAIIINLVKYRLSEWHIHTSNYLSSHRLAWTMTLTFLQDKIH
jgi:hypothetical protein